MNGRVEDWKGGRVEGWKGGGSAPSPSIFQSSILPLFQSLRGLACSILALHQRSRKDGQKD
jgi:hypothetical protein